MTAAADRIEPLVDLPAAGRRFTGTREVRLGDASVDGRLRLDALARYLQDVANDDARDAIGEDAAAWVVRKTTLDILRWPRFQEPLELVTFCGGTGARWAERRTSVHGASGGRIEAASLWVHIDMRSGAPSPLPPSFLHHYGESCAGRKVSGRLSHPQPPSDARPVSWAFRATDLDVMGHVNNAAYWALAEEVLRPGPPGRFELEYRLPVEPAQEVSVVAAEGIVWIIGAAGLHASARVIPLG